METQTLTKETDLSKKEKQGTVREDTDHCRKKMGEDGYKPIVLVNTKALMGKY
ncbi:hypothetical protein [Aquiflexum balticum]|uniref:hypothetical protein n=1 Tax=Aquiflexum balticum TaxID=280473 RepID=UPI0015605C98|nr:hypothetical protein [Aquiflexum balticum]